MYQSIPKLPIPPLRAIPGHLTHIKLRTVGNLTQNEARPVGHLESKWKNIFLEIIGLDSHINRQFNKAVSSYFFMSTVCIFILLLGGDMKGFLVSLQTRISMV